MFALHLIFTGTVIVSFASNQPKNVSQSALRQMLNIALRKAGKAAGCYRWIQDIALLLPTGGNSMRQADRLRHETRLEGAEILEIVRRSGWSPIAAKTFMKDGTPFAIERMKRNGWAADPPGPTPSPDDPAGVWLFHRLDSKA
jgi:hypothetical protein